MRNRFAVLGCALGCILALASPAGASKVIAHNASDIHLAVNAHRQALITYRVNGVVRHVLAWGAINARLRPARAGIPQVKFKLDYAGGWGHFHKSLWKHFRDGCQPYDGPPLAWVVTACKAPDGSYWALQSWQTALPGLGFTPWTVRQQSWWLHLSHWRGPVAKLDVYSDWIWSTHWQELFGQLTYLGVGIRGYGTTLYGNPNDSYGRLIYVDTHNSMYGPGWRREAGFVPSGPPGIFCHGFYRFDPFVNGHAHPRGTPHRRRGPGTGDMYRVVAVGPGVTPDVMWQGPGLHRYNPRNPNDVSLERLMNVKKDQIRAGWHKCRQH
jgi:hypothetical protein